jgi:hypothetical protein
MSNNKGGELRDEIRQPTFDTVVLLATSLLAAVRLFFVTSTSPIPPGGPKSLAMTNMNKPGSFPTATSYLLQGLCIDADNQAAANSGFLGVLLRKSSISLQIGVKNYWQSPLRLACGRMLAEYDNSAAATVYEEYGWPAIQPIVFQGRHVVEINPLQDFSITWQTLAADLTTPENALAVAADTDLWFVASLKGLLRRPVQ